MNTSKKIIIASITGILGVALLTACSSESSTETTNTAQETTQEVNPGNSEGLSQMLPPVIIEENQTEATAKVGDFLDIIVADPETTTIEVENTGILSITQGYSDGSATFNPGAEALKPGVAVILIQNSDGTQREITVTVN